eukprot:2716320-Pleurochrysis_carterae.AAC.1
MAASLAAAADISYLRGSAGEHCANGAHVMFFGEAHLGSTVMRAYVPLLILNQTKGRLHNSSATYFATNNNSQILNRFYGHVYAYGKPSVCVMLKMSQYALLSNACKNMGAILLLDCIDNPDCFRLGAKSWTKQFDSVLVQTSEHAHLLKKINVTTEVCAPCSLRL